MSVALPTIHCWETAHWERQVYLKKVEDGDTTTKAIEVKEDRVVSAEEWTKISAYSGGFPWIAASLGKLTIPSGRYAANREHLSKFYVVSEINGTDPSRDKGFWGEERGVIMAKALVGLIALVPIYALATMFLHLARTVMNLMDCCRKVFKNIQEAWKKGDICEIATLIARTVIVDMTHTVLDGAWSVIRTPFYAIALQAALLYTIISPYNGRQVVADLERAWHAPCTVADDIYFKANAKTDNFDELLHTLNHKVHYLFFCFQPQDSYANDPRYVRLI